jgi:uncharacterized damage-inducible protein DinB
MIERQEPPYILTETDMLTAWLDYHRQTLEWKCEGLAADDLRRRSVPPSTMSLLGLVRHMSEVEGNWFRRVLGRDPEVKYHYLSDGNWDADFDEVDTADVDEAFATWRAECDEARGAVANAKSLDETGVRRGEEVSLRWILTHMIEEYARHNGHADLLRQAIDGATGD